MGGMGIHMRQISSVGRDSLPRVSGDPSTSVIIKDLYHIYYLDFFFTLKK